MTVQILTKQRHSPQSPFRPSMRLAAKHAPWWLEVQLISSSHSCWKKIKVQVQVKKAAKFFEMSVSSGTYQAQSRVICRRAEQSDYCSPLSNLIGALLFTCFMVLFKSARVLRVYSEIPTLCINFNDFLSPPCGPRLSCLPFRLHQTAR